ncbi:hypothetical protein [Natronorubrum halophilum]|uniref:hypothetical protein n=1 Tax=Natronorubrum halophilum TaxID=1702106 RepID=UPI0010C1C364|nr:hypothetical protein [Natronorubrum halophilum]
MTTAVALETIGAVQPLQNGAEVGGNATLEWTRTALLGILGYGLLAGIGVLAVAFAYRALTVRELPIGPAALVGLALPTGWLSAEAIRHGEVIADSPLIHYTSGTFFLGVLFAGTVAASGGHRLGDRLACGAYEIAKLDAGGQIADLVRSAGLAITVTLPPSVDDAEGYPPVDDSVKRELAGKELRLPSGLSIAERRSRVTARIESDYGLGYVRVELAEDGTVSTIIVGDRRTGISPSLGPNRAAVAISGPSLPTASAGDPVDVWTCGDSSRLVATGRLRASAGPVTTLIVDAEDADAFERGERYQLTTRPETRSDANALASAVRSADETVVAIAVEDGGTLESEFVGWVPGTVLAIDRGTAVLSLPAEKVPLEAGDTVYVFGTPLELESLSTGLEAQPASDAGTYSR